MCTGGAVSQWRIETEPYQVGRPGQGVGLPAPGLSVAEDGGGEPVHSHVDQSEGELYYSCFQCRQIIHNLNLGGP